jgi:hypothetical protein
LFIESYRIVTESWHRLDGRALRRFNRRVCQDKQNYDYNCPYPLFTIPTSYHNMIHVHRFISLRALYKLMNHPLSMRSPVDTVRAASTFNRYCRSKVATVRPN